MIPCPPAAAAAPKASNAAWLAFLRANPGWTAPAKVAAAALVIGGAGIACGPDRTRPALPGERLGSTRPGPHWPGETGGGPAAGWGGFGPGAFAQALPFTGREDRPGVARSGPAPGGGAEQVQVASGPFGTAPPFLVVPLVLDAGDAGPPLVESGSRPVPEPAALLVLLPSAGAAVVLRHRWGRRVARDPLAEERCTRA